MNWNDIVRIVISTDFCIFGRRRLWQKDQLTGSPWKHVSYYTQVSLVVEIRFLSQVDREIHSIREAPKSEHTKLLTENFVHGRVSAVSLCCGLFFQWWWENCHFCSLCKQFCCKEVTFAGHSPGGQQWSFFQARRWKHTFAAFLCRPFGLNGLAALAMCAVLSGNSVHWWVMVFYASKFDSVKKKNAYPCLFI